MGMIFVAALASCGAVEEAYVKRMGGYTTRELEDCLSGPGAEVATLLRGNRAPEQYCQCLLGALSEKYTLSERERLSSESVLERDGLLGFTDPAYLDWAEANVRIRGECIRHIVEGK
jgi:hypothetical protein